MGSSAGWPLITTLHAVPARLAWRRAQLATVLLCTRRDAAAARASFPVHCGAGRLGCRWVADRASVYPRVVDEVAPAPHARVTGARSVVTSTGNGPHSGARLKNARAAVPSRRAQTRTSMTWPCWSVARYS
jgi:hypothetical protein